MVLVRKFFEWFSTLLSKFFLKKILLFRHQNFRISCAILLCFIFSICCALFWKEFLKLNLHTYYNWKEFLQQLLPCLTFLSSLLISQDSFWYECHLMLILWIQLLYLSNDTKYILKTFFLCFSYKSVFLLFLWASIFYMRNVLQKSKNSQFWNSWLRCIYVRGG
jgi:hypothetical protein